jgi:signal transduction histidine kinase
MRPRRSLLAKVVAFVTVAYFLIGFATFLPQAILYRSSLLEDRQTLLEFCAQRSAEAYQEVGLAGVAPVSSASPAGPLRGLVNPEVHVYIFEDRRPARVLGFNADGDLTPVPGALPAAVVRRVRERLQLAPSAPLTIPSQASGQFSQQGSLPNAVWREDSELIVLRPLEPANAPRALAYLSVGLYDIERRVLRASLFALLSATALIVILGLWTVVMLRRGLLRPLQLLIRADQAGRAGDHQGALITEGDIPDDELGVVMRSRNRLQLQQYADRAQIDAQLAALRSQKQDLRRWGRELERLVERKSAELVATREALYDQEKLAALGRLAANVAHEINNPLASIAGYAEELRELLSEIPELNDHQDGAEILGGLRIIEDQAFRCKSILTRLLGLARSDKLRLETLDIAEIARDTFALLEVNARQRAVRLRLREPLPECRVLTDRNALIQILTNLIENAIDAARAGAESRGEGLAWVELSLSVLSDGLVLAVADNGLGIPAEARDKIFDEFYTTKPVGRGTGLGLAICQSMSSRLGGRIEVSSISGQGATFSVRLPFKVPPSSGVLLERPANLDDTRLMALDAND